jgi:integrase/recombinase XerD
MSDAPVPAKIARTNRLLTSAEFHQLAAVPPEVEWFANIRNKSTRRAYENAIQDFMGFTGIGRPEKFRTVTRAHVIAWRDDLARRELGGATVRHRLAALSSLFEYLCEKNAVTHNPVKGVKRPRMRVAREKRRPLATIRPVNCSRRRIVIASRTSAIGPSCRRFSITRCGARSCAS